MTGLGDTRAVTLLDSHDLLRFSRPVRIKDHLRGHVIAYSPISAIQEPFAKADALRPEALVIAAWPNFVFATPASPPASPPSATTNRLPSSSRASTAHPSPWPR